MKKSFSTLALATALAGFSLNATAQAVIGAQLEQKLTTMSALDEALVVVTYDQMDALSIDQLEAIADLGIDQAVQFQSLPIIGLVATPAQIDALSADPSIKSIYANRKLTYYNAETRKVTDVERLQSAEFNSNNNLTFTGKGVTVMVNDSGIDATLADLEYGTKVVENVQALTHPQALRIVGAQGVWLQGQLNTDLNVGHGTHCAGTLAGWGTHSDGKHKGAAPGADLIGYGSGAGLSILDSLGGYDYAITHIWDFNSPIRIMSNSWGSSGKFDPNSPITLASYKATKLGILSVFAAGNDGPGEDTHNPYAQIPWGISVGASTKSSDLIDFSSRGKRGESGTFTMPDGTEWTYKNEVSIVAPGVDIISSRAKLNVTSNGGANDADAIEAEYLPYYTMISGTSMATPHVAGIIALMLEANPNLTPLQVKTLLEQTATNMPGYESWEVGAGHVNAYAAVAAALGFDAQNGKTVNNINSFNGNALVAADTAPEPFEVFYSPVGEPDVHTFNVGPNDVWITARAENLANTTKLKLEAPDGTVYFGNLSLPVLTTTMSVSAPAQVGEWKLSGYGMTSLSGVEADPTGETNGPGVPDIISGEISILQSGGYEGLNDIAGHPAENAIQYAVSERLVDSKNDRFYRPDAKLRRQELAKFLVMGMSIKQHRSLLNESEITVPDVGKNWAPYAEAVVQPNAALRGSIQNQGPVMLLDGENFEPRAKVTKQELAYSLIQSLGLQNQVANFEGQITVDYNGTRVPVKDTNLIDEQFSGYVQAAIDMSIIGVRFALEQGPYDLQPTVVAYFEPNSAITRADYAVIIGRVFDGYLN